MVIYSGFTHWKWPIEIVDLPIENGGSFYSYVSLPEGNPPTSATTPNYGNSS